MYICETTSCQGGEMRRSLWRTLFTRRPALCGCRHRHCRRRGDAVTQRIGPVQIERQRLQYADGPDFVAAMHQEAGHAAVLDDAVRPLSQLAATVDFVAFITRHSRSPG